MNPQDGASDAPEEPGVKHLQTVAEEFVDGGNSVFRSWLPTDPGWVGVLTRKTSGCSDRSSGCGSRQASDVRRGARRTVLPALLDGGRRRRRNRATRPRLV